MRARRPRLLVAAVTCLAVLGACAEDDEGPGVEGPGPARSSGVTTTEPTTSEPTIEVLEAALEKRLAMFDDVATGVIAVVRVGDETRTLASGTADLSRDRPMSGDLRFQMASVTKSMVATLVMQLVDEGEVAVTDTAETWLPGILPQGDQITVEHLLSHRSGLVDYTTIPEGPWAVPYDPRGLLRAVARETLSFRPGTRSSYSNTNYIALGLIVEEATGRPLRNVLDRRVFAAAGMRHSTLGMAEVPPGSMVRGYNERDRDVTIEDLAPIASGGVVSTAGDVDRFFAALFRGDLVSAEALAAMTSPVSHIYGDYGYGIGAWDLNCGTAWGHNGGLPGFTSLAYTLPEQDRSVVVLVNNSLATTIAESVATVALCPVEAG